MAVSIVVPQLGESIAEGTVSKWLKSQGDTVQVDEPVVEIMTDKVTVEVPSPAAGVLAKVLVEEGTTVPVDEEIAVIADEGEDVGDGDGDESKPKSEPAKAEKSEPAKAEKSAPEPAAASESKEKAAPSGSPAPAAQPAAAPVATAPQPMPPASATPTPSPPQPIAATAPSTGSTEGKRPYLSPVVRRLAREHNIDATRVPGTGRGGRVTRDDMLSFIERGGTNGSMKAPAPLTAAAAGPAEEVVSITGIRKVISERMAQSKFTATHVTAIEEVDVSALVDLRKKVKEKILDEYGVRLTFTPFFIKSAMLVLREFPKLNATWQGNDEVVIKRYYNIGVAVGRDEGLMVPVVKNVESKSLVEVARDVNDLSARAHEGKLNPDELQGGTFSVTNAGLFGSFATTPIINYPEVAILGVHKISDRPTVVDGEIVIRPMTNLAVSFDHRWIDGHTAVQFLSRLKEVLERPETLWLSV